MPLVPVLRRNQETSPCEVRKSVRDSFGVPRTLEVVAVVKGVAWAQGAVDDLQKQGIFFAGNTRRVGSVENGPNVTHAVLIQASYGFRACVGLTSIQLIFSSGPVLDIFARFSAALKIEFVSSVSDIFRTFFVPFAFRNSAFVAVDAVPQIHHRQKISQNAILQFVR
jgi:hypothetical protein